jgi:hypothetical protein
LYELARARECSLDTGSEVSGRVSCV